MRLSSLCMRGRVKINHVFGLIWRGYGPKRDIFDYWGSIIFFKLSYYILSKDKAL